MKTYIIHLFLLISIAASQSILETDSTDLKIINLTFANNYSEARLNILKKLKTHPNHPKYYFFMSAMYFQQTVNVSSKNDLDDALDSMQVYGQKAIDLGENMEKKTPDVKFYLGASYGYLGRYFAGEREWFKAYSYGKDGKDYLEEVVEENPEFYDAYLGLGIFNYYSAKLGGVIKFLSWIVGMSGDEERGLNFVQIALEKGTLSQLDAKFFLTYIYRDMEYDDSKVTEHLNFFRTNFPENKWAINFELRLHQRDFEYNKIKTLIQENKDKIFDYNLADYYMNALEFDSIESLYSRIKDKSGWRFKNIQNALGFSYWVKNDSVSFNNILSELEEDSWVYKNLSSLEGKYSKTDQEYYAFKKQILFADANEDLSKIIEQFQQKKTLYKAHRIDYLTATYYYKRKDINKAEQFFLKSLRGNKENYWTYRTLAVIYLQHTMPVKNVSLFLEYIDDYDDRFLNLLSDLIEKKYDL